jgi:hypothetical protein
MAKLKVKQLPVPSAPAPSPRLLTLVMTAIGELLVVAIGIVGVVVVANWLLIGFDVSTRPALHQASPFDRVGRHDAEWRPPWKCRWEWDRRRGHVRVCEQAWPAGSGATRL